MLDKQGPVFPKPIREPSDINNLKMTTEEDLEYVYNAVFFTRIALNG
jgi:uroporphyrinogen-III decarboxylase